jgi:O-antigen/teichoic acid export membrane protein
MKSQGIIPDSIDEASNGQDGVLPTEVSAGAANAAPEPAATGVFAKRVASVLATRVTLFAIAFATSLLLSRILGPDGKGSFVAVVTLPGMLAAVGMFGLPGAVNYFASRGSSMRSLVRAVSIFTVILSIVIVTVTWFSLPLLESSILRAAPDNLLRVILLTVPVGILATFWGTILYGRHAVKVYNLIQIEVAAVSLALVVILVGLLRFGVNGAVAGSVIASILTVTAVTVAVRRLGRTSPGGEPASIREIAAYGARLAPASFSNYFNYRADSYIIQALMLNAAYSLGQYSMAVTMDELIFYVPESIATIFLPRVAGSTPEQANLLVGRVGRLTTLITVGLALCLIPVAYVGIHVVLPLYVDCLPAFLVLLPGAIAISISKVLGGYVAGRGRPGLLSVGMIAVLALNVGLNLFFIPRLGIVGASLSSLISYTFQAGIIITVASRLSGQAPLSLFVPGAGEVRLVVETTRRLAGRAMARRHGPKTGGRR